jgi:hypothetical protein
MTTSPAAYDAGGRCRATDDALQPRPKCAVVYSNNLVIPNERPLPTVPYKGGTARSVLLCRSRGPTTRRHSRSPGASARSKSAAELVPQCAALAEEIRRARRSQDSDHWVQNDGADWLRKTRSGNDAGDEKADRQDAPRADEQRNRERRIMEHERRRGSSAFLPRTSRPGRRGKYEFDDHVGGQDGLWTKRRGAKPLEEADFAVDRDDRY